MNWQQKHRDLQKGSHSDLIAQINGHYLVFGESQFLPGYMVLIHKNAEFKRLTDLKFRDQIDFMLLVTCIQASLSSHLEAKDYDFKRCNIEILGNKDHYIHAHIWPRYGWEINHLAQDSVRSYSKTDIEATMKNLEETDRQLDKKEFSIEFFNTLKMNYQEFAQFFDKDDITWPSTVESLRSFS